MVMYVKCIQITSLFPCTGPCRSVVHVLHYGRHPVGPRARELGLDSKQFPVLHCVLRQV